MSKKFSPKSIKFTSIEEVDFSEIVDLSDKNKAEKKKQKKKVTR